MYQKTPIHNKLKNEKKRKREEIGRGTQMQENMDQIAKEDQPLKQ